MKSIIDSYIGLWLIMLFLVLGIAFTSVNMNVVQARKIYSDVKAVVQASNGATVPQDAALEYKSWEDGTVSLSRNGYSYAYKITRKPLSADEGLQADNETWIYNDIYRIDFVYEYNVPLFGRQVYPISGYTY